MPVNGMPYAVQLRELHRQELYAEADHERLVRQAATTTHSPRREAARLLFLLTGIWRKIVVPWNQPAPVAMDVSVLAADDL